MDRENYARNGLKNENSGDGLFGRSYRGIIGAAIIAIWFLFLDAVIRLPF